MSFPFSLLPVLLSTAFYFYSTWDGSNADVYDGGSYQASGTFTVPAAWNGRKVRASAGAILSGGSAVTLTIQKNGAAFDGRGHGAFPNVSSTNEGGTVHTAPIVVATGDTFTISGRGTGDGNWGGVELLPSGVKGALVNRITSGFSVGTAATGVQWNNEVYDTDGYHDNTTNPSRITIPSGSSGLVRIQANVSLAAAQSQMGLAIKKNGSIIHQHESTLEHLNVMSPPISCTTGDYFEIEVYCSVATTVQVSGSSWMSIEELPSGLKYATTNGSNSSTLPTGGVWTQHDGGTENTDVGSWYTGGGSLFTVPSGVTRVRVGFYGGSNTGLPNAVEQCLFKNGSDFNLSPHNNQNSSGVEYRHAASAIIDCSPGDTFEFYLRTGAGSQTGYGAYWIEEVPTVTS